MRWGRLAAGLVSGLLVLSAGVGVLAYRIVQRKVAHVPKLELRSEAAKDFTFRSLEGETKHLSDFKGKVIFLDLWGTWCVQCVAEMPAVETLYKEFQDDRRVQFLIVSRMDTPQSVRRFARLRKLDLPFYVMRDDEIPPEMYLQQYPSTFIYSGDGRLVAEHAGGADWADPSVIKLIRSLE